MDRLLIVEDEKMARAGLRAMVSRAGVTVGEILECRNGEEALALLKTTPVDAVFTDVRMPKMDGLTLLRRIQEELPEPPEVVVISGHDDFDSAVEAMRYGSREFMLKPVGRARVAEILEKLEAIISQKKENRQKQLSYEEMGRRQLKYMLMSPEPMGDELDTIKNALGDLFAEGGYAVICLNRGAQLPQDEEYLQIENVGAFNILAVNAARRHDFVARHLSALCVGVSGAYQELGDFRHAFSEAVMGRKYAFFTGRSATEPQDVHFAEEELAQMPIARRLGSKEYGTLVHLFNSLFAAAARGLLYPHVFEGCLLPFLEELSVLFTRYITPEDETFPRLRDIYGYDTLEDYQTAFLAWLDHLHHRVQGEAERFRNRERMEEAVRFIEANYNKSLNMAVVSNHISMNYTVFSQLFKDYSGQNFVDYLRDLRIEQARRLLSETDMKISEISASIGFDSDKYFMRTFKSVMGISPTEYRRNEANLG